MVLRYFLFIWGTILALLVSFALFIEVADIGPPRSAVVQFQIAQIEHQLSTIMDNEGINAAQKMRERISDITPEIDVTFDNNTITVSSDIGPRSSFLSSPAFWMPVGVGATFSALASMLLSRLLSRPLDVVRSGILSLARGELETRISHRMKTRNPSLIELGKSFDIAATQLQEFSDSRRKLLHDVSHEIRSPLARLRAALELSQISPDRHQKMMDQMSSDINRMDMLVSEILTVTQLNVKGMEIHKEQIDLVDILEPIISDAKFEGEANNIAIKYDGPEQIAFFGNTELLHRAFENVIRNALSHSPSGGCVTVQAKQDTQFTEICITDQGEGIPPNDINRIFEPFVRAKSVGRAKGYGLGLTIAAQSVRLHKGTICAKNNQPGGFTIEMRLQHK